MQGAKLALEVEIDIEIIGIASGVRLSHHEAILVHHSERKTGAVFHQVRRRGVAHRNSSFPEGSAWAAGHTPHVKAIGRVPGERPRRLRAKRGVLEAVIHHALVREADRVYPANHSNWPANVRRKLKSTASYRSRRVFCNW